MDSIQMVLLNNLLSIHIPSQDHTLLLVPALHLFTAGPLSPNERVDEG